MKRIEQEKEKALEDFEMTVKPDIIAEIEGRENERINAMKAELDKKSAENLKLENLIKEQRIYISSNYEAYLGKEYVTVEKLTGIKTGYDIWRCSNGCAGTCSVSGEAFVRNV